VTKDIASERSGYHTDIELDPHILCKSENRGKKERKKKEMKLAGEATVFEDHHFPAVVRVCKGEHFED
jgi:hypothetical protein